MTARASIGVLLLAGACGRESDDGASSEVLEILEATRSADIDPEGEWISMNGPRARLLSVQKGAIARGWILRSQVLRLKEASEKTGPPQSELVGGELSDGILTLESPLVGSLHLHLCRVAGEEFLVPENGVQVSKGKASKLTGTLFKRIEETIYSEPPVPVVEELPAGVWEGVDCPEWAWLKIVPTGAPDGYVVRRSQLLAGTPAHTFVGASWEEGVLRLDSPLFDNQGWCVRHVGEEDWLVPMTELRAASGNDHALFGMRFRLANRVTRPRLDPRQLMEF